MSRDLKVIGPDMTIGEAAKKMRDGDFRMMPVEEDDRMIGTISDCGIAIRAVAEALSEISQPSQPPRCHRGHHETAPQGIDQTRGSRKPMNPRQFPSSAQAEPTAGREKVREVPYPLRAARQTNRRVGGKGSKNQTGS
jgi:hypothetical protein